ncbi:85/88 kDa calcium-independent phospholipase A2 [Holothuria leucospilota]|uniref:phospholipase A2 n=1 Tax=Holothuria leucospilota TaxID=206669 RepID=A0A9Q1C1G8_HOLLE|nr:85/88 kDa calcium-independent phospholipase A2 [Holothuria leucospilota]
MAGVWKTLISSSNDVINISAEKADLWECKLMSSNSRIKLLLDDNGEFHCVVLNDGTAFSLFRESSEEAALEGYNFFVEKIEPFLDLDSTLITQDRLKELCSCCRKNPSYSPAHVAVDCNFLDGFSSEAVLSHLNSQEGNKGQTPLHLAVKTRRVDLVKTLRELGANAYSPDFNGITPMHEAVDVYNHTDDGVMIAVLASMMQKEKLSGDFLEAASPLLMALQTGKFDAARIMVENDVLIDIPDDFGMPIHYALKHDNYLLATEILAKQGSQGFARCNKYGATPLHWARSSETMKMIFQFDYELNVRSKTGHTAVHVMVLKNRVECLVELLAAGADPEIPDNEGNSPLHSACKLNDVDSIRALIVFNADVNAKNKEGLTPRHYAASHELKGGEALQALHHVEARRCEKQTISCRQGCLPWGRYDGDELEYPHDPQEECEYVYKDLMDSVVNDVLAKCREYHESDGNKGEPMDKLLCLDGGGSRGVIQIQLLSAIERASDKRIIDTFDWIAGTSAGAINTGILSKGCCITAMRKTFFSCTKDLFAGSKPYSGEKIENILKEIFGEKKMKDIEKPKVMITGALSNRAPPALHLFRNYPPPSTSSSRIVSFSGHYSNPPWPADEEKIWHAIRSSTAAPTYFPPRDLFMDGGLVANNPTTDAMTEISEYYAERKLKGLPVRKIGLVVSLGTGNGPVSEMKDIEVYIPKNVTDIFRVGAHIKAAAHLGEIMLELVTDSRFRPTDRSRAWCFDIGAPFFRLSPPLSHMTELDETDTKVILRLMWETEVFICKNREKIDQIGQLIRAM